MKSTTSRSEASVEPYAKILVADEFRTEQSGKILAIGLYSDGVVVLTIPKNAPPATKETPYGIERLALLITVGGFEGDDVVRFGFEGGQVFEHPVSLLPGNSANVILNLKPFRTLTFGMKKVYVEFAGTKRTLQFEVRANFIEPVEDLHKYIDLAPAQIRLNAPASRKTKAAAKKAPGKSRAK